MVRTILSVMAFALLLNANAAQAAPPGNFTALIKSAGPAVVNINTEKLVEARSRGQFPFPSPLFEEFFGMDPDMFGGQQTPRQRKQRSLGSGFIISADGYIVTNHHVVEGADSIHVSFDGKGGKEETRKAELVGSDKITDLAVLKIDGNNLPFLKLGDSDAIDVGEWVVAIGNPFGLDHTVTAGIISAKGRKIRSNPFDSFLQTDASINPGNSGGPLLNMAGEVIGINAAIIANGQGIGFAIPSNMAEEIIGKLRTDRKVSRGWIGVTIQSLDAGGAKALGLPEAKGALVGDVVPGHPADKAGMKPGDVILSVDGDAIDDSNDLSRKVAAIAPGKTAQFVVWRAGSKVALRVKTAERDSRTTLADAPKGTDRKNLTTRLIGLSVRPVTKEDAGSLRLDSDNGLLVTRVEDGGKAEEAGIRAGDVILSANGKAVNTPGELADILETQGRNRGAVMLHLVRHGGKFFRTVDVADN